MGISQLSQNLEILDAATTNEINNDEMDLTTTVTPVTHATEEIDREEPMCM